MKRNQNLLIKTLYFTQLASVSICVAVTGVYDDDNSVFEVKEMNCSN